MKKVQILIEVELDEEEIEKVETNTVEADHLTKDEFIKGLEVKESDNRDSGAVSIFNEDEEYYLMNIGDGTRCMKNPKIVKLEEV